MPFLLLNQQKTTLEILKLYSDDLPKFCCYFCQGERSKYWCRLSNHFFWLCLFVHMMTHNAGRRHNSNDIIASTAQTATLAYTVITSTLSATAKQPYVLPPISLYLCLTDLCCHGNEIWDKMGNNSVCIRDIFQDLCV